MVYMLLQASGLTKKYGDKLALDHVDLKIRRGQLIAYLYFYPGRLSAVIGATAGFAGSLSKGWKQMFLGGICHN